MYEIFTFPKLKYSEISNTSKECERNTNHVILHFPQAYSVYFYSGLVAIEKTRWQSKSVSGFDWALYWVAG